MRELHEIAFAPLGICLGLAAMLLAMAQIALLMLALRQRRSRAHVLLAGLHLLLGLVFLTLLLDGRYRLEYLPYPRAYLPFVTRFHRLPWLLTLGLELADTAALGLAATDAYRYSRQHPTLQTVKEAVDQLPTGVCISGTGGEVLLSNCAMNDWSRILTDSPLSEVGLLRRSVREKGKEKEGSISWTSRTVRRCSSRSRRCIGTGGSISSSPPRM